MHLSVQALLKLILPFRNGHLIPVTLTVIESLCLGLSNDMTAVSDLSYDPAAVSVPGQFMHIYVLLGNTE